VVALAILLIGLTGMVQVLLFADRVIYGMYGFHINGFVLDLVFTPGGIASLGASRSTELTATLVVIALLALQAVTYLLGDAPYCGSASQAVDACVRVGYSWPSWVLRPANASPTVSVRPPTTSRFFLPASATRCTCRRLSADSLRSLGIKASCFRSLPTGLHIKNSVLNYPLLPLRVEPPARPLNIVWLAVESLRFDLLDRAIMPQTLGFFRAGAAPGESLQRRQYHPDGHLLDVLRLSTATTGFRCRRRADPRS
jgi:hypothetical protein